MVNCCTIFVCSRNGLSVITFIVTSVSSETVLYINTYHSQYFNTPIRRRRSSPDISAGISLKMVKRPKAPHFRRWNSPFITFKHRIIYKAAYMLLNMGASALASSYGRLLHSLILSSITVRR